MAARSSPRTGVVEFIQERGGRGGEGMGGIIRAQFPHLGRDDPVCPIFGPSSSRQAQLNDQPFPASSSFSPLPVLPPRRLLLPLVTLDNPPPPTHRIGSQHLWAHETRDSLAILRVPCRADAEPVDQKNKLEERCKPLCVKSLYEYERCVKRVENDGSGQKHCTGQYFDYWSCVDKCVAPKLLDKLK
nr:uncharacterized protein LOC117864921 [Setaria viridis]